MKYLLFLICLCSAIRAADPQDPAKTDIRTRLYRVPTDIIPRQLQKALPPQSAGVPQYDVRAYLWQNGVELAPDEEAVYEPDSGILIVRGRAEVIDMVATFGFLGCPAYERPNLLVEAVLVQFDTGKAGELSGAVSVEQLRKAAADSWRVLSRSLVNTEPNVRALAVSKSSTSASPPVANAPESEGHWQPGESGATLEVETRLAPDDRTSTVNLVYRYRGSGVGAGEWEAQVSAMVRVGVPTVLQMHAAPAEANAASATTTRALILRLDVYYDDGNKVRPSTRPPQKSN